MREGHAAEVLDVVLQALPQPIGSAAYVSKGILLPSSCVLQRALKLRLPANTAVVLSA